MKYKINLSIKFKSNMIYKAALHFAVEKENIEIIKLLLLNDKLDINLLNI